MDASRSSVSGGSGGDGPPRAPEVMGRYEIRRRIGWGGQGAVYLAYDPHLDIDVALKVLHAEVGSADFVERFKIEAQTMVRLTHPNIVRVYDYNPSHPYIVMEYCDGGDLTAILKRRERLSLAQICRIAREILAAMQVAHGLARPVLHRDLKPGNVLFHRGVAKIADFGLAKVLGSDSSLTQTRSLMGTVRYTSPEQCTDPSRVDHRTDLWSVGVLLAELLSWERPFDRPGDGFVNIAMRIGSEPPQAPSVALPEPLWAFIEHALEKVPGDRFASAAEMSSAFEDAARQVDPTLERLFPDESAIGEADRAAQQAAELFEQGRLDEARALVEGLSRSGGDGTLARYWQQKLENKQAGDEAARTRPATASTVLRFAAEASSLRALRGGWVLPVATSILAIVVMAVVVALFPHVFFGATSAGESSLTLLAPTRTQTITRAFRDGERIPALELQLEAGEVLTRRLPPGRYELERERGETLRFELPQDGTIVLVDGVSSALEQILASSETPPGAIGAREGEQ